MKAPVSLTPEELLAILGKAREHRLRDWVVLLFLCWHGLRVSEAVRSSTRQAGLFFTREKAEQRLAEIGDGIIEEVSRRVKGKPRICYLVTAGRPIVKPGLTYGSVSDGEVTVRRLKRSLQTTQPLQEHDNPLLNEKLAWEEWLREAPLLGKKGAARAGVNSNGGRHRAKMQQKDVLLHFDPTASVFSLSRSQLFRLWQRYATEAGLPRRKRHPHCAKHTIGTMLVESGLTLPEVQAYLGHASVASTGKYTLAKEDVVSRKAGRALAGRSEFAPQMGFQFGKN